MNAAQMLAAAGEPNTTAGRAKFHQRFPSKTAFDAWYNSKKEYGGGLTEGIAFPQQPDGSSRRAPYYDKGGIFAPNVMPWNGPIGFYEHGGLHKYQGDIGGSQVPRRGYNNDEPLIEDPYLVSQDIHGMDAWHAPLAPNSGPRIPTGPNLPPGFVFPSPNTPYIPGLELGVDVDRNPNVNIGLDDPYTRKKHPSGGGGSSRHHQPIGKQISRWWDKNFQGRGGGRKYNVANCWNGKCHEYGGMTDGIAFPQQPTEHINFSAFPWKPKYDMGGMNYNMGGLPMNDNGEPCYECGGNMAYGGYMEDGGYMNTGATTEMDQGAYTNGMAQEYMKSLADFSMAAQPMPMGNAQEAGYGAYGTEVGNNQMSDFNTLDMNNINNTSLMQTQLDQLKNNRSNSFTNLLNVPANMAANTYLKKPTYTTETVGSGMTGPTAPPAGTSNNWTDTRSNMAAEQAAGNMFKEYGGDFFQNGGNNVNYQNRVQDILMRGQAAPKFAPSKIQMPGSTQQSPSATQQTTANTQQYTPEQIAAFQAYMQQMQGNYAPSWQAQQNQNNGYDAWKAMSRDPEALKKFLSNSGIQDMKWNNKMGMFGPKSKGHITFRTFWDASKGKYVKSAVDEKAAASDQSGTTQPGAGQQMQKGPKGPGFIQNLIAKNKQRKAGKQATRDQALKDQQFANSRIAQATPGTTDPVNYFGQDFENNNRLSPGMQAELSKGQRMPLTGDERKKQFFDNRLDQDTDRPSPTPQDSIPYYPGSEPIGFAYGGFPQYGYGGYSQYGYGGAPQYNYGGYPEYEEGAELDMSPEEIENYLAMGGTLEYLD